MVNHAELSFVIFVLYFTEALCWESPGSNAFAMQQAGEAENVDIQVMTPSCKMQRITISGFTAIWCVSASDCDVYEALACIKSASRSVGSFIEPEPTCE